MVSDDRNGLSELAVALARKRSGWHWHENHENRLVAIFPSVPTYGADSPARRELEKSWEAKARALTESQVGVEVEPKEPPSFPGFHKLRRGD